MGTMDMIFTHLMFVALFFFGIYFLYDPKEKNKEAIWLNRFFLFGFVIINGFRWLLLAIGIHLPQLLH